MKYFGLEQMRKQKRQKGEFNFKCLLEISQVNQGLFRRTKSKLIAIGAKGKIGCHLGCYFICVTKKIKNRGGEKKAESAATRISLQFSFTFQIQFYYQTRSTLIEVEVGFLEEDIVATPFNPSLKHTIGERGIPGILSLLYVESHQH